MKTFFERLGIRVIKTMSQTALGVIGSSALLSEINWAVVASSVVVAGICCVLMNLSQLEEPKDTE